MIGAGGVATVAAFKIAQNTDVFTDFMIASRRKEKCDKIVEDIHKAGLTMNISTAQVDADDVEQLKADVEDLKIRVERMESDLLILKRKVDDIEIHIENSTDRNIRILAENFIDLMTKLNQAIPAADKSQLYEIRVDYLIIEVEKLKKNVKMLMEKTA